MFDLEDTGGIIRCILWPDGFAQYGQLVQPDATLVVRGVIDKRPGSDESNLIVNELIPLEDLPTRYTRGVKIRLMEETHAEQKLQQLHEILRGYPGHCELHLLICLADGSRVPCTCDNFRVAYCSEMRSRVEELLGPGNFQLITAAPGTVANGRRNGRFGS